MAWAFPDIKAALIPSDTDRPGIQVTTPDGLAATPEILAECIHRVKRDYQPDDYVAIRVRDLAAMDRALFHISNAAHQARYRPIGVEP